MGMMPPVSLTPQPAWGVASLCLALAEHMATRFNPVTVRGEISGFTRASSGHCYFSLKDEAGTALLRCAMFKRAASGLDFVPRDGMLVELNGRIGVYEARGDLQLVVEQMAMAGQGALLARFLRFKEKLQAEGLFDPERKRPIPLAPRGIGVVTSLGAAALHDVCSALQRRVPHIPVTIAAAAVQGPAAAQELVEAMQKLEAKGGIDVILLIRGGGSLEDLWSFNEEVLVRQVAACSIPVLTGIGHETDFTLCDFAADMRAPTPTAAAEMCALARSEWLAYTEGLAQQLAQVLARQIERMGQELDDAQQRLLRPQAWLAERQADARALQQRLATALARERQRHAQQLAHMLERLEALNPQRVLERGYAMLTDAQGAVLSSVEQLHLGQSVLANMADGTVSLAVQTQPQRGP